MAAKKYIVTVDAVSITIGVKKNGEPKVARLLLGTPLVLPDNPTEQAQESVETLLAQGSITEFAKAGEWAKELSKQGSARKPFVVKHPRGFRVTAAGLAHVAEADDEIVPDKPEAETLSF